MIHKIRNKRKFEFLSLCTFIYNLSDRNLIMDCNM